jgi:uncharacterized tellurite resistance protein B-like protein
MKDMTKKEIANIIHVLAYLAKIDNVVDPAEKKIFKIVCERFGIKIPELREILKESVSLKKSLNAINSKELKNILVNLMVLMVSVDGNVCDNQKKSIVKIMDSIGESAKDYFFFDKDGDLDLQLVIDNELKILSNLPPTHPI